MTSAIGKAHILDGKRSFDLVEIVDVVHVGSDGCREHGGLIVLDDVELMQISRCDLHGEVASQGFRVAEVEASFEVEVKLVVGNVDVAVEAVVTEVSIQRDIVNVVAE